MSILTVDSTHTEDLRRITHTQFYEAYRKQTLLKLGFNDNPADQPPVRCDECYNARISDHVAQLA